MAARIPRKLAQAGKAEGLRVAKATEMMRVTRACRMQMAVTESAVRYVGVFAVVEAGAVGSVGDVARGK